jgi:hypothetical protein
MDRFTLKKNGENFKVSNYDVLQEAKRKSKYST